MNNKQSFKAEIADCKKRGRKFIFSFDDTKIPVIYNEQQDVISVDTPEYSISVKTDYSIDLGDNLDVLLNKLLEKYPQLVY
jgi:hypothetical protein